MRPLRVMTYNVRYFGHGTRGLASTKRSMSGIAKAIAQLEPLPDIVCLQEVETASVRANLAHWRTSDDDTQLSRLMQALHEELAAAGKKDSYSAHYFPAHTYKLTAGTNFYTTGLAILAHADHVIAHSNADAPAEITHRRKPTSTWKQTRICAHARFSLRGNGDSIDIFNVHVSLPATWTKEFWGGKERMGYGPNQLSEAVNLVRHLRAAAASDRFLVVGDFNSLPGSPVHQFLRSEGLDDGFRTCVGKNDDDFCKKWPTAGFLHMRFRLDHVFGGPGLKFTDFDESQPFGAKKSRFHGLSDHVPLIARLVLR